VGDAGVMGGAAADTMLMSGIQTVTGAKTYNDQKLVYRNPANTFSLTSRTPAITANLDTRVSLPFSYYIFKDGSNYYAKNGFTTGIDYSGSVADVVIQSAITAVLALGRPGKILFSPDDFPMNAPLDIPTAIASSVKPLHLIGIHNSSRDFGTRFSATTSFPTNRYFIETSGCTDLSNKFARLFISDIGGYNLNFATRNVGFLKFEADPSTNKDIIVQNVYTQYLWRGIHLIGAVWWGVFSGLHFEDQNSAFIGDADIVLEQGSHTNATVNPWPKANMFKDVLAIHSGTVAGGGSMNNSLKAIDSGYNIFQNYVVDSNCVFNESIFSFTGKASANEMDHCMVLDTNQTPSPDNRAGCLYLSGTNCFDNKFRSMRLTDYKYMLAIKGGAYRNDIEMAGYWGANLDIDDSGSGIDNIVRIFPGVLAAATPQSKPTTTGGTGNIRIIDNRKGAITQGVSTQSGNASTTAFNIAHGCFTTPLTYTVIPQTVDARGTPIVTATSTNLVITYPSAPPIGTNNLTWVWTAGVY
jgi:hypothetical protein